MAHIAASLSDGADAATHVLDPPVTSFPTETEKTTRASCSLRATGAHFMQGCRFGRRVPPAEISERLHHPGAFKPSDIALASQAVGR